MQNMLACCVGIPVIASILMTITIVPVAIILFGGIILSLIILFPQILCHTYYTIIVSRRFGLNMKCFMFLFVWIVVFLTIPLVIIAAIGLFIFYGCLFPFYTSFAFVFSSDPEYPNEISLHNVRYSCDAVVHFYRVYGDDIKRYLNIQKTPFPDGHIIEIRVLQTFISLVVSIISMLISGTTITLIATVKFVPCLLKAMWIITKSFSDQIILWFPVYIICLASVMIVVILAYPCSIMLGFFCGARGGIVFYHTGNLFSVLQKIGANLYAYDQFVNDMCFDGSVSMFHRLKEIPEIQNVPEYQNTLEQRQLRNAQQNPISVPAIIQNQQIHVNQPQPSQNYQVATQPRQTITLITISQVWENFFRMCLCNGIEIRAAHLCTTDDLKSFDTKIIIGLPSIVIYRMLDRSKDGTGFVLSDGQILTELNRPTDFFSTVTYNSMLVLKDTLIKIKLIDIEEKFLEKWLICSDEESYKIELKQITEERRKRLIHFGGQVQDYAIKISMVPTFGTLFKDVVTGILHTPQII